MDFKNDRYITRGVQTNISKVLQILMWEMIDAMEVDKKDYLQVFELERRNGQQKIVHKQEEPKYEKTYCFDLNDTFFFIGKVYVIDDETHSTMLLAEEY